MHFMGVRTGRNIALAAFLEGTCRRGVSKAGAVFSSWVPLAVK